MNGYNWGKALEYGWGRDIWNERNSYSDSDQRMGFNLSNFRGGFGDNEISLNNEYSPFSMNNISNDSMPNDSYDSYYRAPEKTWAQSNPKTAMGLGAAFGAVGSIMDTIQQNRAIGDYNRQVREQRKALDKASTELGSYRNLLEGRNVGTSTDLMNRYLMADRDTASNIGQTYLSSRQQYDQNILGLTGQLADIAKQRGSLKEKKKIGFGEGLLNVGLGAGLGFLGMSGGLNSTKS